MANKDDEDDERVFGHIDTGGRLMLRRVDRPPASKTEAPIAAPARCPYNTQPCGTLCPMFEETLNTYILHCAQHEILKDRLPFKAP